MIVEARDLFRVHSTPEGDAAALQGLTLSVEEGEILTLFGSHVTLLDENSIRCNKGYALWP